MDRRSLVRVVPVLVALALAMPLRAQGLPRATPESLGFSPERLGRLDEALARDVQGGEIAGTVALVARGGKIVHVFLSGYQDLERRVPVREDTIFRIASFSKAVTSVAALILVEEGRLVLSDPVSRYVPAFRETMVAGPGGPVRAKREITVRDLLTHTAGLSYGAGPAAEAWKAAGLKGWWFGQRAEPLSALVDRIAALPIDAQPGEKWVYGVSHDVLGRVIEVASGQPLDRFLAGRIFGPVGMPDTSFFVPKEKVGRLATVYTRDGSRLVPAPDGPSGPRAFVDGPRLCLGGGAGLVSTALDYARFLQMLLNGGILDGVRVLAPRTVATMTSNHAGALYEEGRLGFGFGFEVVEDPGRAGRVSAPGEFAWGSGYDGGYLVDPRDGVLALYLAQRVPERGPRQRRVFSALVYQSIVGATP